MARAAKHHPASLCHTLVQPVITRHLPVRTSKSLNMLCTHIRRLILRTVLPVWMLFFLHSVPACAQHVPQPSHQPTHAAPRPFPIHDHDTTYYQSYSRSLTARFYFSKKFTGLQPGKDASVVRFRYLPNTSLVTGVGVTYQSISLNLGYGFGFLNPNHQKGKTRYLDLQSHVYARKWTIDLFGQFYKGYYLSPKGLAAAAPGDYYQRPDLRIQLVGVSAYRLLNPARFSYRAALLQNEQQKKSAGSWLLGAEVYYGVIKADSSLVPQALTANDHQRVQKVDFFKIGPGGGYAYTFVIEKQFFVTASLCASLSLDHTSQNGADGYAEKFALNTGFVYRLVAGYNRDYWNVNASLVGNELTVTAASDAGKYRMAAGNIRLTFAKIIRPGRALRKKLRPIDTIIENTKGNP